MLLLIVLLDIPVTNANSGQYFHHKGISWQLTARLDHRGQRSLTTFMVTLDTSPCFSFKIVLVQPNLSDAGPSKSFFLIFREKSSNGPSLPRYLTRANVVIFRVNARIAGKGTRLLKPTSTRNQKKIGNLREQSEERK